MAALRGNLLQYVSQSNPKSSVARFFISRGFATTLFVKGLSFSSSESTLAKAFSECGEVVEAKIITDRVSNRSKGFGYVTYSNDEEAQNALTEMDGKVIDGRAVYVDTARLRIKHT